uniref:Protein kinase C and casein kinase substrate in neurons protein 1 n=1 Tax=Aceria tosichella TaxID=561515 RepID=A0A6G1SCZ5_9ACAR
MPYHYKKTTKRIEDGFKLCNDLVQLVQERCDIEKNYAKSLSSWSNKWNNTISRGPEYGTTEAAWKALLTEADRLNELHLLVKDKLMENVIGKIKQWQKEKFHRSMMQLKEKKELDDEFKKVQKPWAKALERVNKCKHDYHTACKVERTLSNQERNASSDSSFSPDQLQKIRERVAKAQEEVSKSKERYEIALKDIGQMNHGYMTEMTQVFQKCQAMEEERLKFFKDVLFDIHDCLNISTNPELPNIYEEFKHSIQNADAAKDIKWWSNTYGIGMNTSWPQFEAFSEEFRDIIKDPKVKKVVLSNDGVTLINQHRFNEELPEWNDSFTTNGSVADSGELTASSHGGGVSVRALYDYEGAEGDELTFKQGDVFEKLEDEDEQGWCKGRKGDQIGLYPANYVEVITEKDR